MRRLVLALLALCLTLTPITAQVSGFIPPVGSNITSSSTATTAAFTASLAASGTAGTTGAKTNYICGFVVTAGGTTTATVVNVTITGTVSGTMNFAFVAPSSGQGLLGVAFPQCIGASASGTAITVNVPALGAGTVAAASIWGFQV
jgi:PKD repeat protein